METDSQKPERDRDEVCSFGMLVVEVLWMCGASGVSDLGEVRFRAERCWALALEASSL